MPDLPKAHGQPELTALLTAVAKGDEAAYGALWTAMIPRVQALAERYLGSADEGDEVAQEVFLHIWRKAASFDPTKGSAQAWIFTIARNASRDRARRRKLRWLAGFDPLPDEVMDEAPNPETQIADSQDLAQLQAALIHLPDRQRMALLLSTIAGLDTPEIAAIMKTSQGAVEQLVVRARKSLRVRLQRG